MGTQGRRRAVEGTVLRELEVEHRSRAISQFVDELVQRAGGSPDAVVVAIERPRGGLVEALLERGLHVCSLNPKQLDRFRDRHTVAGAKDDRLDAYVLADALRTDRPRFRQVEVDDPLIVQIRELSRIHEDLRAEENRLINRLREQVHRCAPQLLGLSPATDEPWFWALLERGIGPRRTGPRRRSIEKLLKEHRIRRLSAEEVYAVLQEPAMHLAPETLEAVRAPRSVMAPRCGPMAARRPSPDEAANDGPFRCAEGVTHGSETPSITGPA